MFIEFEKWHGNKNDFIVTWATQTQYANIGPSLQRKAIELCARNSGIGADGLMILIHPVNQDLPQKLLIINSDGSLAKTCGNGIRCAALSVYKRVLEKQAKALESIELNVEQISYTCQFIPQKNALPLVQVNMGPTSLDDKNTWHRGALSFLKEKLIEHKAEHLIPFAHTCSLANQHLVFILEEEETLKRMRELGEALQESPHWDGINVSFASPLESNDLRIPTGMQDLEKADPYKVFVWERGAGETPACGSAACAVSSIILNTELIPRSSWIPTLFPGGWLFSKQDTEDEEILLCGPGEFVFKGSLEI